MAALREPFLYRRLLPTARPEDDGRQPRTLPSQGARTPSSFGDCLLYVIATL
jgi:hypothetical protein